MIATTHVAVTKAVPNVALVTRVLVAAKLGSETNSTIDAQPKASRTRGEAPRALPEATRSRPMRAAMMMAPPIPNTAMLTSEFTLVIVALVRECPVRGPVGHSGTGHRAGARPETVRALSATIGPGACRACRGMLVCPPCAGGGRVAVAGDPNSGRDGSAAVLHAGTGGTLVNTQLRRHPVAQVGHVTDHADRAAAVAQPVQHFEDLLQGVLVQGPEPLVHEQCVDVGASGLRPGDVTQAQCQSEGTEEGLPSRQRRRVALHTGP